MTNFEVVDLETARNGRGLRLLVLAEVPSPWSVAAKAFCELKRLPVQVVRITGRDEAAQAWTGVRNAPVAIYDDEPPRSGWAEILALTERLEPAVPLVPSDPRDRALLFGLSHEIMGEGGLLWSARLLTLEASFASDGQAAFPVRFAKHLAARYGFVDGTVAPARARVRQAYQLLEAQLAGKPYFFGDQLTALDVYSAAALHMLAPLPHEQCPMHPIARAAFGWAADHLKSELPRALVEHRDRIYAKHLTLPLAM